MKKLISLLLTAALLLAMCSTGVVVSAEQSEIIVNVKDFGAKGDGVTSDKAAIMSAFAYAVYHYASKSIPVTVYFPEGEYGLKQGGMYIDMPYGSGNLTVKGAGADKSTIVYLEEWVTGGSWVALRFKTEAKPEVPEDYLHDITIQDLGVYDTNPIEHAWSADAGDPGTEETHGFNIQYCYRAKIINCKIDNVGDEALDMTHCYDSEMTNNLVVNSPGAGGAGGSISAGEECDNVLIANNTIIGSVQGKTNWAIAVEALDSHVQNIMVRDNVIQGMKGYGINVGAPAGTIANVVVKDNVITDCRDGGIRTMGSGQTDNVQILNNTIRNTATGISIEGSNKDGTLIENCVMDTLSSAGVSVSAPSSNNTLVRNCTITNSQNRAVYNAGTDTKIDHVLIDGTGLLGNLKTGAITQYASSGSCEVTDTVILNCQNKKGTENVQRVINTYIQQPEASGYSGITAAEYVKDCKVNRLMQVKKGSTIDGLVLSTGAELGTHAATVSHPGCTITNSVFYMPTNATRYAIYENGSETDNNTFTGNLSVGGKGVRVIGANTIGTDNFKATEGATDAFRYCIADGKVTIVEALDTTMTELVIPATIDGCPVVRIAPWAFGLCDALTSVQYQGTRAAWDAMTIDACNDPLLNAALRCYSDRYSKTVRHSVMDTSHGNGLAFRFELHASGVGVYGGNCVNVANATIDYMGVECKLLGMGAVVTNDAELGTANLTHELVNGVNVLDIPAVYLQEVEDDYCAFAVRIINIPDSAVEKTVYARPYYIIEVDGEQLTVYDAVNAAACADFM